MIFHNLKSCAIQEIHGLHDYGLNAEKMMISFCNGIFTKPIKFFTETVSDGAIYQFYIFSGGSWSKSVLSAEKFATLITEQGLGKLWKSPALGNETFHTGHTNTMWVWMPDKKALKKWFELHK